MITWPASIPGPIMGSQISIGTTVARNRAISGRVDVRQFGSGAPDIIDGTVRIANEDIPAFLVFYEETLNKGINWASAHWLPDWGYSSHAVRILGHPKRTAYGPAYGAFSVKLEIKPAADVWADTGWGT